MKEKFFLVTTFFLITTMTKTEPLNVFIGENEVIEHGDIWIDDYSIKGLNNSTLIINSTSPALGFGGTANLGTLIINSSDNAIDTRLEKTTEITTDNLKITAGYMGVFNTDTSKGTKITVKNDIDITGGTHTVRNHSDSDINIESKEGNISIYSKGTDSKPRSGIHSDSSGNINIKASKGLIDIKTISLGGSGVSSEKGASIDVSGLKGISITALNNGSGVSSLNNSKISLSSDEGIIDINGTATALNASQNSKIDITSKKLNINGDITSTTGGDISLNAKESTVIKGTATVDQDSNLDITFNNFSTWKLTGSSNVSSIYATYTLFDFSGTTDRVTLDIGTIKEGSDKNLFKLKVTPEWNDFLTAKFDNSSTNYVSIHEDYINNMKEHNFIDKPIHFANVSSNTIFKGYALENPGYIYKYTPVIEAKENITIDNLEERDFSENWNNWYITGIKSESLTKPVEKILDFANVRYMDAALMRLELDTLHKRLGDIKNYNETSGVWFRTSAGKMKHSSVENKFSMIQVGSDKVHNFETGKWLTGAAFQYRYSDMNLNNDGTGKSNAYAGSLYNSWVSKNNQYFDLVGKFTFIDSEMKTKDKFENKVSGSYDSGAGSISLEYGKKLISRNEKYFLQPNAQMTYTYLGKSSYTTNTKLRIKNSSVNSTVGRLGAYSGYNNLNNLSLFTKFNVAREFSADYDTTVKGLDTTLTKKNTSKETWYEIGLGFDYKVKDYFNIYGELERTIDAKYELELQGTLGFRYSFY